MVELISAVLDCSIYKCAKPDASSNVCIGEDSNIYYLSPCIDILNSYCPPEFDLINVTCTTPPSKSYTAYPGEKCSQNTDCLYGFCNQGFCYGQDFGGDCSSHGECNPGYRCDPGLMKCIFLIDSTSNGCITDYDCAVDMGCDEGYCIKYYSVASKNWINNCTNSISNICESGQCLYGLCIDPLTSYQKTPIQCGSEYDCMSLNLIDNGIKVYSNCTCGFGNKGYSYCYLFPGDKEYQIMLKLRKQLIKSNIAENCNTIRRWTKECILSQGSPSFAIEFEYATYNALYYPMLHDAEDCVLQVAFSDYYQDLEKLKNYGLSMLGGLTILTIL